MVAGRARCRNVARAAPESMPSASGPAPLARMLGEAGATVYCTGRSSRTRPHTSDPKFPAARKRSRKPLKWSIPLVAVGYPSASTMLPKRKLLLLFERVERDE